MAGYVHRVGELLEWLQTPDSDTGAGSCAADSVAPLGSVRVSVEGDGALVIDNLTVTDPTGRPLLAGVSFAVHRGGYPQSLFITGKSGCGKSTLLRVIAGLCDSASVPPTGCVTRPQLLSEVLAVAVGASGSPVRVVLAVADACSILYFTTCTIPIAPFLCCVK